MSIKLEVNKFIINTEYFILWFQLFRGHWQIPWRPFCQILQIVQIIK